MTSASIWASTSEERDRKPLLSVGLFSSVLENALLKSLPLINVFDAPYEAWETRTPTSEEMQANGNPYPVKQRLKANIADALSAGNYVAEYGPENGLDNHIADSLTGSAGFKAWLNEMPSKTPPVLARFQKNHSKRNDQAVSAEINQCGRFLSQGQYLFHGGLWPGGANLVTTRPLSMSFSPVVAFQDALREGNAYNANRLDLWVLRAVAPKTNAFVFKQSGTSLGHEKEVLLASGASLTRVSETLMRDDFQAQNAYGPTKPIPIHVLEINVS